jgi:hypothetical protein
VPEHPANEERRLFGFRIEPDQSVGRMAEFTLEGNPCRA